MATAARRERQPRGNAEDRSGKHPVPRDSTKTEPATGGSILPGEQTVAQHAPRITRSSMQDISGQADAGETTGTGDTPDIQSDAFYAQPILNSPYEYPARHWELDESNRPTNRIVDTRRPSAYVSPIPKPRKRQAQQLTLVADETAKAVASGDQQYDLTRFINGVRQAVDRWRNLPESAWRVTPETARLLRHWRHHAFSDIRPFFCQGRGGRDCDLADGGRAQARQGGARVPGGT